MQKLLLLLSFLLISYFAFGQTNQDKILELVKEGVVYHDGKQYQKAIEKYKKALAIDKKSTLTNYEIAMTYSEIGEHKQAIRHANRVLKQQEEHMIAAYTVKANSLDVQGKTKKSIKLLKQALAETKGHYLLHYNLGINYFKQGDISLAADQFVEAVKKNPSHGSSHLYLALSQKNLDNVVPSLLANMYFLLLEPATNRAGNAYDLMIENLNGNVSPDSDDPKNVTILIGAEMEGNPYSSVELMIGLLAAARYTEDAKTISKEERFIKDNRSLLSSTSALDIDTKDIFTDFYIPFYGKLLLSEHFDTFCYYITHGSNIAAADWCDAHPEELQDLFKWLNG